MVKTRVHIKNSKSILNTTTNKIQKVKTNSTKPSISDKCSTRLLRSENISNITKQVQFLEKGVHEGKTKGTDTSNSRRNIKACQLRIKNLSENNKEINEATTTKNQRRHALEKSHNKIKKNLENNLDTVKHLKLRKNKAKNKKIIDDKKAKEQEKNKYPAPLINDIISAQSIDTCGGTYPKLKKCSVMIKKIKNSSNTFNRQPLKQQETNISKQTKMVAHNLAKKPNVIEQILFENDEDAQPLETVISATAAAETTSEAAPTTSTLKATTKTYKFFHKTNDSKPIPTKKAKHKSLAKRKSAVYEFLSQSKTNDKNNGKRDDPTADIIKKMIASGKVSVATMRKGCGKPKFKATARIPKKLRIVGKRKQCSLKDICEVPTNQVENVEPTATTNSTNAVLLSRPNIEHNFDRPISPYVMSPVFEADNNLDSDNDDVEHLNNHSTYNQLARTALENGKNKNNLNRNQLLDIARKYVSTPNDKRSSHANSITPGAGMSQSIIISPIMASKSGSSSSLLNSTQRHKTQCMSPWRVPDNVPLPNTFFFAQGDSNLPSFSSHFIPSTPMKKKQLQLQKSLTPTHQTLIEKSNEENVTPPLEPIPRNTANTTNVNNLSEINEPNENYMHLPNPRRTENHRSPFKPIQIQDVIVLPPWNNKSKQTTQVQAQITPAKNTTQYQKNQENRNQQKSCDDFLFDFDERIEEETESALPTSGAQTTTIQTKTANRTLHEKLKKLRNLLPAKDEVTPLTRVPMRYAYDDLEAGGPRQRKIKEMLCSTMINQEQLPAVAVVSEEEAIANEPTDIEDDWNSNTKVLFKEFEQPNHTYTRAVKRRKKPRQIVMLHDSDNSNDEDDHNNTKDEMPEHKKKCTRKDKDFENELNTFVTTFNEMCEEVDQYNLMVE